MERGGGGGDKLRERLIKNVRHWQSVLSGVSNFVRVTAVMVFIYKWNNTPLMSGPGINMAVVSAFERVTTQLYVVFT